MSLRPPGSRLHFRPSPSQLGSSSLDLTSIPLAAMAVNFLSFLSPPELPPEKNEYARLECSLPLFSPHPASPGPLSLRSAICLNPLRHDARDLSGLGEDGEAGGASARRLECLALRASAFPWISARFVGSSVPP